MANFQKVPDDILKHMPKNFTDDWKTVLRRPGTYSLFDTNEWRLVVPNNEIGSDKGPQARLIGMWGGQDGGQRLDVRVTSPTPGLQIDLVSETTVAPHLWLWCITAEWPQCLTRPVQTAIIGVTTAAESNRPVGSAFAGELPLLITPQGAFGTNLPDWAGGTRDQTRDAIMSECERQAVLLDTQVAYLLATCEHECGFRPIREGQFGGHDAQASETFRRRLHYYPYYGRGYVQLTHKRNYNSFGDRLNIELVGDPDLALEPDVALYVLVYGVTNGAFGTAMTHFINARRTDFVNARRSVNALDRAEQIATIAERWLSWIRANQPKRFARGYQPPGAPGARGIPLPSARPTQGVAR
jgi:hypothetical protein